MTITFHLNVASPPTVTLARKWKWGENFKIKETNCFSKSEVDRIAHVRELEEVVVEFVDSLSIVERIGW
jgi:hypothetical protein